MVGRSKLQQLFMPATWLMGRMSYARKFALLGMMFIIVIATVLCNLYASLHQTIHDSHLELEGMALIAPISRTVQLIQQHRGISAGLAGGSETMLDMHTTKGLEVRAAFGLMESKLPSDMSSGEDFRSIKANLEHLLKDGANLSAEENFDANTRLIHRLRLFKAAAADRYLLTVDHEIGAYYLLDTAINELPDLLEHLGHVRAYGAGILARRQIDWLQKIVIYRKMAELEDALDSFMTAIDKSGHYNPAIKKMLDTTSHAAADSVQRIEGLVESDILTGRFSTPPEEFMLMSTMSINENYEQLYETLLPEAEKLIEARIARAEYTLYASIIVALLLFLTAVYFAIGVYLVISDSIKSLVGSAKSFASGDMNARARLSARDELSQIGVSFNEMAYGFNAMIEAAKQTEAMLRKSGEEIKDLYNHAPCGYHSLDMNGMILRINNTELDWLGYTQEEVEGKMKWTELLAPDSIQIFLEHFEILKERGVVCDLEMEIIRKDHTTFTGLVNATAIYDASGNYVTSRTTVFDITQRKKAEEEINWLAYYDQLTCLPNRRLLLDRLQHAMAVSSRSDRYGALLFLDLDHFKTVNDTQGHTMGDLLLNEVARRMQSCVRKGDSVARLGGDEFLVLLEDLSSEADEAATQTESIAEKIHDRLVECYVLNNYECHITPSIGITLFLGQMKNIEDLLKYADLAMYQAKDAGRNAIRFFDPQMQAALDNRTAMEADMRQALSRQQLRLHYQVQVDSSGRATGAEVLLRWQHPERGLVSPDMFIPLAEETGMIVPIGLWALQTACTQINSWQQDAQTRDLTLAVNVSARQFRQPDFVAQVQRVLAESGAKPSLIKLELTESAMLDNIQDTIAKMHEIKKLGVSFSMDDFGTGYSSLSYLQRLPLDQIKIDQSFVREIARDASNAVIVQTIIAMARTLGLHVIAEGVETAEQQELLCFHGCGHYQGYLFGKPLPIEQFDYLIGMRVAQKTASGS